MDRNRVTVLLFRCECRFRGCPAHCAHPFGFIVAVAHPSLRKNVKWLDSSMCRALLKLLQSVRDSEACLSKAKVMVRMGTDTRERAAARGSARSTARSFVLTLVVWCCCCCCCCCVVDVVVVVGGGGGGSVAVVVAPSLCCCSSNKPVHSAARAGLLTSLKPFLRVRAFVHSFIRCCAPASVLTLRRV